MSAARKTFCKEERLCSVKTISSLFEEGNVIYTNLFRIVWQYNDLTQEYPARVAFSVAKKGFRLAVTRNLLKRRMREAWRKNKVRLYEHLNKKQRKISLFIVFRGNSINDYFTIEKSVNELIDKLCGII